MNLQIRKFPSVQPKVILNATDAVASAKKWKYKRISKTNVGVNSFARALRQSDKYQISKPLYNNCSATWL